MSPVAPDNGSAIPTRGAWLDNAPKPRQGRTTRAIIKRNTSSTSMVFIVGVVAMLVGLAVAMQASDYDLWGGLLYGSILLMFTIPLATRSARRENDPKAGRIILLAAFAKLVVGTAIRYYVVYYVYKASDAEGYFKTGIDLAPQFRQFDFSGLGSNIVGTRFIEVLAGVAIAILNETRLGVFVVFSFMGFLGLYLFYQAFLIAFPEGDHKRYRLLVFFWPSILFWPSSLGKDAWMLLMLGMCAIGVAHLFVGRFRGFTWLAFGSLGCIMVRPHILLMVVAAFAMGLLLRRNRGAYTRLLARPFGTFLLLGCMVVFGALVFQQAQSFLKLDSIDVETAQTILDNTSNQTDEGGSSFSPPDPTSPVGYLEAAATVMFRPLPTEAGGSALIAGLEGVALAGLFALSWRRLIRIVRMSLRNAWVAFSVGYAAIFVFAFSSISNFGILARERASQFFPVLFVLLAIPKRQRGEFADEDLLDEDLIDDDVPVTIAG